MHNLSRYANFEAVGMHVSSYSNSRMMYAASQSGLKTLVDI